jgi:hypothetical protein
MRAGAVSLLVMLLPWAAVQTKLTGIDDSTGGATMLTSSLNFLSNMTNEACQTLALNQNSKFHLDIHMRCQKAVPQVYPLAFLCPDS